MKAFEQTSINIIIYQRIHPHINNMNTYQKHINTYQLATIIIYLPQIFGAGPVALPRQFVSFENYVKTHGMTPNTFIQGLPWPGWAAGWLGWLGWRGLLGRGCIGCRLTYNKTHLKMKRFD